MTPSATFMVTLATMELVWFLVPGPELLPSRWRPAGFLLIAAGIVLHQRGWSLFRRIGTTLDADGNPTVLVTEGPFRLTRNPMYLAGVLILSGAAIAFGTLTPIPVVVLWTLLVRVRFIQTEEASMRLVFGEAYEAYCMRVRRWL